jgi:ribosomal protein L17
MFDLSPDIARKLKEMEEQFEAQKRALLRESIKPLEDELRQVEHQIATLEARAEALRSKIDAAIGVARGGKAAKTRSKRSPMKFEQKTAKIADIFREENIQHGYPVKGVVKRLAKEAHLSPADLSSKNLGKFLPPGWGVTGSGVKKTFVRIGD